MLIPFSAHQVFTDFPLDRHARMRSLHSDSFAACLIALTSISALHPSLRFSWILRESLSPPEFPFLLSHFSCMFAVRGIVVRLLSKKENNNTKREKNAYVAELKLLCASFVVFIHVDFPGDLGLVMNYVSRFAVPLFFIISGYYSYHAGVKTITKRLRKISSSIVYESRSVKFCM